MNKILIEQYKKYGIDLEKVIEKLAKTRISLHCWQLDDVQGFEAETKLTGGIQATGNYLGKPRNKKEFFIDLEMALKFIPGKKNINIHAIYQTNEIKERSLIGPHQFKDWVDFAKQHQVGLDFNPTIFSSPMLINGLSLSSPIKEVRDYWIQHTINSIKVSEYFAEQLNQKTLCNIWIPDGLKDSPSDRLGPRLRLKDSLDTILKNPYDKNLVDIAVESKVFGIGVESYTVGSHEFYLNYASKNQILCLLDTGHFHPTENVADKISSMLTFFPRLALHVSRPVRWDSDHVLKLNDELQEVADELVKCDALEKTYIGLDFFDASINRVAALIIGARNIQKAILRALLTPWNILKEAQNAGDFTKVLALQEEIKTLPWAEVWKEYLVANQCSLEDEWYPQIKEYEVHTLEKRK